MKRKFNCRVGSMQLHIRVIWTQWYLGIWWWPIRKDLAFGLLLGPLSFTLDRREL